MSLLLLVLAATAGHALLPSAVAWSVRLPSLPTPRFHTNSLGDKNYQRRINLVFPGTKWCGSGSTAESMDDLGPLAETDSCCREHDTCADVIESGESAHGLQNDAFYTRVNCDCDERFLDCLHGDAAAASHLVGVVYFDVLNTRCFRLDHPVVRCARNYGFSSRCEQYELNTTADKRWQWFDVARF